MGSSEGLEHAWARHQRHHLAIKAGLEAMGLKFVVKEGARLPQMNPVHVPEGIAEAAAHHAYAAQHAAAAKAKAVRK